MKPIQLTCYYSSQIIPILVDTTKAFISYIYSIFLTNIYMTKNTLLQNYDRPNSVLYLVDEILCNVMKNVFVFVFYKILFKTAPY